MLPEKRSEALVEALRFLVTSSIPAHHKQILIAAVLEAQRADTAAQLALETQQRSDADWAPHELEMLQQCLQGRLPRSWQEADEILMQLATLLKRNPAGVRAKATELGHGSAVDYRLAKAELRLKATP